MKPHDAACRSMALLSDPNAPGYILNQIEARHYLCRVIAKLEQMPDLLRSLLLGFAPAPEALQIGSPQMTRAIVELAGAPDM
jgi:hypothetical protein